MLPSRLVAKLILLNGPRGGDDVELGTRLEVGRQPGLDLVLPDEGVSKRHARFVLQGDRHFLVDQESLNGTYVNRRRVKEHKLRHRDEIRIGSTRILFIDPRQAREEAIGLSISFKEGERSTLRVEDAETTAVFKLPESDEPDELGRFMQEFEKLHMAFRVGGELTGILEEEEIGRRVLEELFQILRADRGVFFQASGQQGNLQQVFAVDDQGRGGGELKVSIARSVVRAAAARRVGILIQDLPLDPRFGEQEKDNLARSALAVPLVRRGQLLGAIHLENIQQPHAFTSDDMDLVLGVGVHVAAALENLALYRDVEGERQARERVSRYLSPNLVEQVVQGKKDINLGGEKADITVLFADLRGFTASAESMPPDEVVVMLNEFFELAVDLIFKFGGTLDKFIGDAVMAFWGVPARRVIDPHLTVMTALKMQAEVHCLNERRRKLGKAELGLGVGIHTGLAVAGNIGTQQRMDYTVIGDTVNLASRIQDLAPGGQVLISQATRERMGKLLVVDEHQETAVKGRTGRVDLYRVQGMYLQEQVAHELRKVRRMQTCIRVRLDGEDEESRYPGVLVDISPVGSGVIFEESARYRFQIGEEIRLELREGEGPFSGWIVARVAAVREVFERAGTVYLHVGLELSEKGLPESVREFFFAQED